MSTLLRIVLGTLVVSAVIFAAAYFIPWKMVTWGKIETLPGQTVTVIGEAKQEQQNQLASFTAGVDSVNNDRDAAIAEVNQKVASLIEAVKNFGIQASDIKTQNLSIFRQEEMYTENGSQRTRPGQWRVSNSIEIILRDVTKASALADLLASSGATNVYGPNFRVDDTTTVEESLMKEAIADAQRKAQYVANSSGRKVGDILNVTEGVSSNYPIAFEGRGAGGGGAPIEPGTQTIRKSVTVVFELK